jgi:beta-lactamase class A
LKRLGRRGLLLLVLVAAAASAKEPLDRQLRGIAAASQGRISMSCSLPGSSLSCDIDPTAHPPMQSVFKLPLALTVLHQVEQGKFSLDQRIRFRRADRILPKPYSPLQDKYPEAGVDVPLRALLDMTVSLSDNTAADILLRLAGGPQAVGTYIASLGVRGFRLRDGERVLHRDERLQYRNWFEPQGAVQLLRRISDDSPLSAEHNALLLGWMRSAVRTKRLQADLPEGIVVAHKPGTSDVVNGVAAATNDIGLITLPDGRKLAIAVFLTDSTAGDEARDRLIAQLGRAVYDAAVAESSPLESSPH